MRYHVISLALLLLATDVYGQQTQTTVVPDVVVQGDSIYITNEVNVEVMSDSVRLARIADATESLADYLENCGCVNTGPTTVNVVANAALTVAAFLIVWQLKGIKDSRGGTDGTDGVNGQDGLPGAPGKDGADGQDGVDGQDGRDGDEHDSESGESG